MKALVNQTYGTADVLSIAEVARPVPGDDEVLVKVAAASINRADWYLLTGKPYFLRLNPGGLRRPRITILGCDVAGVVEAVGANVTRFQTGDAVYGDLSDAGNGAFAEYVAAPAGVLAPKPRNLTFAQAAALPLAAVTALQGLRTGGIKAGQRVLIHGASGGVGAYAVQLAKAMGAEVTAVCSTGKLAQARALGADHVIDYTREDFATNGGQYDLILGVNGSRSLTDYRRALRPNGVYVAVGGSMRQIFGALLLGRLLSGKDGKTLRSSTTKVNQADLLTIKEMAEAGQITPLIEGSYSLDDGRAAMQLFGLGRAAGKLVLIIGQPHPVEQVIAAPVPEKVQ